MSTSTVKEQPVSVAGETGVRALRESDLAEADRILRSAFNTFTGVPDLFGDKDYVRTRWSADPVSCLAAEVDGALVGSNFAARWGSVGFFGPLSVRPELWDRGIAGRIMDATVALFEAWGTRHAGLFTFPHSPKHLGLYQKHGFRPGYLTPVVSRPVGCTDQAPAATLYSSLSTGDQAGALAVCAELTGTAYEGLDLTREIRALSDGGLGDVVLLDDTAGLAGLAVCHLGAGTEAGSRGCYVKFGMARSGPGVAGRFEALIDACESLAAERGADHVELGVNASHTEAYAAVAARGYRAAMIGVTMHRGKDLGYARPDTWIIDDWR